MQQRIIIHNLIENFTDQCTLQSGRVCGRNSLGLLAASLRLLSYLVGVKHVEKGVSRFCEAEGKKLDSCVQCPRKMGINVTSFGLPILLTSLQMEREREGERNLLRKEMGYRVFFDVNRIGRPKAVTYILILLGHYRLLLKEFINMQNLFYKTSFLTLSVCKSQHMFHILSNSVF